MSESIIRVNHTRYEESVIRRIASIMPTCSSPIFERSHTWSRRSVPEEARMVSLWGDHCTWKISSVCDSKECSLSLRFLRSHSATVLSADPDARMNSEYGLKLRQLTSAECASTV